jgi:hypothetical protein
MLVAAPGLIDDLAAKAGSNPHTPTSNLLIRSGKDRTPENWNGHVARSLKMSDLRGGELWISPASTAVSRI